MNHIRVINYATIVFFVCILTGCGSIVIVGEGPFFSRIQVKQIKQELDNWNHPHTYFYEGKEKAQAAANKYSGTCETGVIFRKVWKNGKIVATKIFPMFSRTVHKYDIITAGDRVLKIGDRYNFSTPLTYKKYKMRMKEMYRLLEVEKKVNITLQKGDLIYTTKLCHFEAYKESPLCFDIMGEMALVTVLSFNGNGFTYDFRRIMKTCFNKGIKKVVIDVRDNGGGTTYNGLYMVQQFCAEEIHQYTQPITLPKPLMDAIGNLKYVFWSSCSRYINLWSFAKINFYSKEFYKKKIMTYPIPKEEKYGLKMKVAVLVNKHSASCSEVISGLLQHYKRGKVFSADPKTYGKYFGQYSTFLNEEGSVYMLMPAFTWHFPDGRTVKGGLSPDEVVTAQEGQKGDFVLERARAYLQE